MACLVAAGHGPDHTEGIEIIDGQYGGDAQRDIRLRREGGRAGHDQLRSITSAVQGVSAHIRGLRRGGGKDERGFSERVTGCAADLPMVRDRSRSVRGDAADQVRSECAGAIYIIRRLDRRVHCCHSALGDGGGRRRNPRRDVSHAEDEWVAPDGAVTRCRAGGEQSQDELNFLAGQRVQIFVELIDHPLVLFPPRPQDVDRAVIDLIVESEGDVAGRSVGAAHGRMEMVTGRTVYSGKKPWI